MIRLALNVRGVVQGVGFRPFIQRAAMARGLCGWVQNGTQGVRIEVQGADQAVREFVAELVAAAPPAARVESVAVAELAPLHEVGFRILESESSGSVLPTIPPDLATCSACLTEVESAAERRYRYPFTNCTQCGPRYTILERLPYDRPNTAMARFAMCQACQLEYEDPEDRRFHAQPIACPACGPRLQLLSPTGAVLASDDAALQGAVTAVERGEVLALKGMGGFQLLVDASNPAAVLRLRHRKQRAEKPFAVMFPSLEAIREACVVSPEEEALLASPAAPIVLVLGRRGSTIAEAVAPKNPRSGALLPYTPLHHLLLREFSRPVVCTSGNLSEEPMCICESEALSRLGTVADLFLVHDRPIVRPVDDSVTRLGPTGPQVLRRARGYVPLADPFPVDASILALGGQLKNTVTLAQRGRAVVSQHLGDLASSEALLLLERTVQDLTEFFDFEPEALACDLHPDYASTQVAEKLALSWRVSLERVQHHHAHIAACMAEHHLSGPVLGLAWDGSGLGTDGTLWGGETLLVTGSGFSRVACLRSFPLPGGERAVREPRRAALGLLFEACGRSAAGVLGALFTDTELSVLLRMLERKVHTPRTTSLGRLFDAIAALAGLRTFQSFEGQAAMDLEFAAADVEDRTAYSLPLDNGNPAVADWEPLVRSVLFDVQYGVEPARISKRFHNALVDLAEVTALRFNIPQIVLSGGCFQNLHLVQGVYHRLVTRGFEVYLPQRYPPNDGGLSLGQAYVAALRKQKSLCA